MTGKCWNALCIASDCDGAHHLDATGHTVSQRRGEEFCLMHDRYDECEPDARAEAAHVAALRSTTEEPTPPEPWSRATG